LWCGTAATNGRHTGKLLQLWRSRAQQSRFDVRLELIFTIVTEECLRLFPADNV
jgi:hypothetical protein